MELDNLMDIPLLCECELGETSITVKRFLELETGSIIKLNTLAGGNAMLVVSGKRLLTGEIGTDGKKFSVKVIDIANNNKK